MVCDKIRENIGVFSCAERKKVLEIVPYLSVGSNQGIVSISTKLHPKLYIFKVVSAGRRKKGHLRELQCGLICAIVSVGS